LIRSNRIGAIMLFGHIVKISAKLLPFDNCKSRVQCA